MNFISQLITAPTTTPVSVAETKTYLRIDGSDEDTLLATLIGSATRTLEEELSMKFISQVWDFFADSFGEGRKAPWWDGSRDMAISALMSTDPMNLPFGRIISLDQFSTYPDSGVPVNETVGNYIVDTWSKQGRISLKTGASWPVTVLRSVGGIRIRCTVGFGDAAAVPQDIKQAIMELVAHMYENRGDQSKMEIPPHVLSLVKSWKVVRIG